MTDLASAVAAPSKLRQILDGAKSVFFDVGFEGAGVDEIARRAGVSKATMYSYFPDKRALFAAVVEEECREQARRLFSIDRDDDQPVALALATFAHRLVSLLMTPFAQSMYRIAVAEAVRFPELGRAFYESGPDLGVRHLAEYLAYGCGRGELVIDDVDMAAHQFVELCRARLFYRVLLGVQRSPTAEDIATIADAAVAVFLKAYGVGGHGQVGST